MVRRQKVTVFLDNKQTDQVLVMKKMLESILHVNSDNLQLTYNGAVMEDKKTLSDYSLTSSTARAQAPATLHLAYRVDGSFFLFLSVLKKTFSILVPSFRY